MALRDKLVEGPLRPPPKTCSVCWILTWIGDDDREVLEVMLGDYSRYPGTTIGLLLADEFNVVVGGEAVQRHRRLHMGDES